MMKFRKAIISIVILIIMLTATLSVGFAMSNAEDEVGFEIPIITATEEIDGAQATLLPFGYSWDTSQSSTIACGIATWQGEYADENTIVIDREIGQGAITLSAEKPSSASYKIYLPDGAVYDNGEREPFSSSSLNLSWNENKTRIILYSPYEPGEYIYEVTIGWEENNLKVTYGIKLVMTGKRSAFDAALDTVWEHNKSVRVTSLVGREILKNAEYAGECYVFDIELPNGIKRVAVSKEQGIYFTYNDGTWFAFTGASEEEDTYAKRLKLADIIAISEKIGADLTLSDLSGFECEDVGSGIFIMRYGFEDGPYMLLVGSSDRENVLYAELIHRGQRETDESIDIRYYDVAKFINSGAKEIVRTPPESDDIKVVLNDSELAFDIPPQLVDGRTMVPMRKIFESMGAEVDWNGDIQTITSTKDATVIVMQIDNLVISVSGEEIVLDVPPRLIAGRTLVPVRAVAEGLGADVEWDSNTQTVRISK